MRTQYRNTDKDGNKFYYLDKEMTILHREGGPSMELVDGSKYWCINGKLHRTDGPAIEWADGTKMWYLDGKVHRDDGPAIKFANGSEIWCVNGKPVYENGMMKFQEN
jgi:hypothetical protein